MEAIGRVFYYCIALFVIAFVVMVIWRLVLIAVSFIISLGFALLIIAIVLGALKAMFSR